MGGKSNSCSIDAVVITHTDIGVPIVVVVIERQDVKEVKGRQRVSRFDKVLTTYGINLMKYTSHRYAHLLTCTRVNRTGLPLTLGGKGYEVPSISALFGILPLTRIL